MEASQLLASAKKFAQENLLATSLFLLGLMLLVGGMIWLMFSDNGLDSQPQIEFEQGQSATASEKEIIVDVGGAVLSPGVYKLQKEARIQDALIAAGGLSSAANREYVSKYINLAQKLTDAEKIYIPSTSDSTGKNDAKVLGSSTLININTASADILSSLPGIGPQTSQKIIDGRPYGSTNDLLNKKIIGKSVWEKIKDKISIY